MAVAENGAPEVWDLSSKNKLSEMLIPYMQVSQKCFDKKGCISPKVVETGLAGEVRYNYVDNYLNYGLVRLKDGVVLFYVYAYPGCTYDSEQTDSEGNPITIKVKGVCGQLQAFINENEKNKMGLDNFAFTITSKGVFPSGYADSDYGVKKYCNVKNSTVGNSNGSTCGEWIRRFKNADYWYKN